MAINFLKRSRLIKGIVTKLQEAVYGKTLPTSDSGWLSYYYDLAEQVQMLAAVKKQEYKNKRDVVASSFAQCEQRWFTLTIKKQTEEKLRVYQRSWWWQRLRMRWQDKDLILKLDIYRYRQVQDTLTKFSLQPESQQAKALVLALQDAKAAIREPLLKRALQQFSQWLKLRGQKGYPLRGYVAYRTQLANAAEGSSAKRLGQLQSLAQEKNFYVLLGLKNGYVYTAKELHHAYKTQLKQYHIDWLLADSKQPDLNQHKELATEVSQRIIVAYNILKDAKECRKWQAWYAAHKDIPQAQWPLSINWYDFYKTNIAVCNNYNAGYTAEFLREGQLAQKKLMMEIENLEQKIQYHRQKLEEQREDYIKKLETMLQQYQGLDRIVQQGKAGWEKRFLQNIGKVEELKQKMQKVKKKYHQDNDAAEKIIQALIEEREEKLRQLEEEPVENHQLDKKNDEKFTARHSLPLTFIKPQSPSTAEKNMAGNAQPLGRQLLKGIIFGLQANKKEASVANNFKASAMSNKR